jgi:alpha-mannosidase
MIDQILHGQVRTLCLSFGFCLAALGAVAQPVNQATQQTLYYIPHTHWEGAVFKTREEYLEMGLPHILKALYLLKKYPDFKFTLDQVAYFKPFLERYPEEAADFRKFVAEGRLQIVGGMDVMPDDVKPGGELFIRQMQYGKQYCREALGVDVTVAWLLDTFGHHPQLPQLLKQAGYSSFWFCRGVPKNDLPSEFFWQGIDGTRIPAFWLPGFYGLFYGPPREQAGFARFFKQRFDSLDSHANGLERVGLAGVDVSEPEEYVPSLVSQFNRQADAPFKIRYSVPTEFAAAVARRTNTPVLSGDFNPIFPGTYSSRIELKQITRDVERRLLTAEKLAALAAWLGSPAGDRNLWGAWEPVLFNQTHDLASGVMTDHVYEDVMRGYDQSGRLANERISACWKSVASRIDTQGKGIPIVVFNSLGWTRNDVAEVETGFAADEVRGLSLVDDAGKETPFQILQSSRYADGGLEQVRLCFIARDVPALGYAVYHLVPRQTAPPSGGSEPEVAGTDTIENDFYRVRFNRAGGELTSLYDKALKWEALAGPANVVARQEDKGDLWELYRGLDGGSFIAMTNRQAVPTTGTAQLSSAWTAKPGTIRRGPVFSEFRVAHPLTNGSFATRVRLFNGMRRLDIETAIVNNEKYVRYQTLFPTSVKGGHQFQEIPFGAIERPEGIEFPAQQWVDYSGGGRGVALLNAGLPGNLVSDGTVMVSLLRSHNLGAYGFGGGYEPGMSSESGFELGRERTLHYGLVVHDGDWRTAEIFREGMEFNHPLLVWKTDAHRGDLPARWGLLQISHPNVVMTAFKPGRGREVFLRVYEASGEATPAVKIKMYTRLSAACESDLLEASGRKLKVRKDTVEFDLHPFEIKTIKLVPAQP